MELSPVAEEGGRVVCRLYQYKLDYCFHYGIFIPIFPVWAIYREGSVSNTTDGSWLVDGLLAAL